MSDKIKLIIEIPKYYLECSQNYTCLAECVRRGTPLDDVKAEIRKLKYFPATSEYELDYNAGLIATIDILDNIGKEREE